MQTPFFYGKSFVNGISDFSNDDHFKYHYVHLIIIYFYVVTETAMGVSVNALSKPNSEYVLAVKE